MAEKQQQHRKFQPSLNFCRSRVAKEEIEEPQQKNYSYYFALTSTQVERARRFAVNRDGVIHETENGIQFECKRGHIWSCVLPKMRWCEECAKLVKKEKKLRIKKEEEQFWQAQAEEQQALFTQAKRKYSDPGIPITPLRRKNSVDDVQEQTIRLQALDFTSKDRQVTYDMAYNVYKTLGMSQNQLRVLILQSSEYYKLCLEVHPDKNKHPLATEAFQKIINAKNQSY